MLVVSDGITGVVDTGHCISSRSGSNSDQKSADGQTLKLMKVGSSGNIWQEESCMIGKSVTIFIHNLLLIYGSTW